MTDKVFHSEDEIKKFANRLQKTLGSVPHLSSLNIDQVDKDQDDKELKEMKK